MEHLCTYVCMYVRMYVCKYCLVDIHGNQMMNKYTETPNAKYHKVQYFNEG